MTEATEDPTDDPIPDLTREELQDLEDVLAFIGEMCDQADADGSVVTTTRVRSWLAYTGCGGAIVLPEDTQERVRAALDKEPK